MSHEGKFKYPFFVKPFAGNGVHTWEATVLSICPFDYLPYIRVRGVQGVPLKWNAVLVGYYEEDPKTDDSSVTLILCGKPETWA